MYQDKNWCLAEDHIHFTIGKLASALKQKETTIAEFAKLFEKPSAQSPAQQANFLKEYFVSLTVRLSWSPFLLNLSLKRFLILLLRSTKE